MRARDKAVGTCNTLSLLASILFSPPSTQAGHRTGVERLDGHIERVSVQNFMFAVSHPFAKKGEQLVMIGSCCVEVHNKTISTFFRSKSGKMEKEDA